MNKLKSVLGTSLQIIVGVPILLLVIFSQFSGCISEASLLAEHGVGALFGARKVSPAAEYFQAADKVRRCEGVLYLSESDTVRVEIAYLKIESGPLAGEYHDIWLWRLKSLWKERQFQTLNGTIISAEEVPVLESAGGRFSRGSHRRFDESVTGTQGLSGFALINEMRSNGTLREIK